MTDEELDNIGYHLWMVICFLVEVAAIVGLSFGILWLILKAASLLTGEI